MSGSYPYYRGERPDSDRRAPQRPAGKNLDGTTRMAIVAVGAAIGAFLVWPLIRPVFIGGETSYPARAPETYGAASAGDRQPSRSGQEPDADGIQMDRQDNPTRWRACHRRSGNVTCDPWQPLPSRQGRR
jgi:hypothetical protein